MLSYAQNTDIDWTGAAQCWLFTWIFICGPIMLLDVLHG